MRYSGFGDLHSIVTRNKNTSLKLNISAFIDFCLKKIKEIYRENRMLMAGVENSAEME